MNTNRTLVITAEVAILAALATVFDWVASLYSPMIWPNGGSIGLSMLPVFIIAFRRGLVPALITGFLLGVLQNVLEVTYVAPYSLLSSICSYILDYPLAFTLVGLSGVTYKWVQSNNKRLQYWGIVVGILFGGIARTISHVVSGALFWRVTWVGSIIYNVGYMAFSIAICLILALAINTFARYLYTRDTSHGTTSKLSV